MLFQNTVVPPLSGQQLTEHSVTKAEVTVLLEYFNYGVHSIRVIGYK